MQAALALLYVCGLAGSVLSLRALARPEPGRRGYLYAAASSSMFAAVLVIGLAG